jgi:dihydrofolate reductase
MSRRSTREPGRAALATAWLDEFAPQSSSFFHVNEEEWLMGRLIVTEFMTLDGVAQAPGGPDEDRASGFAHGGWQAPLLDDASGVAMFQQAQAMDALLLGRRTYEMFAGYWPQAPTEIPFTGLLNRVPKYVASRTLSEPLAWSGSSLVPGDVATGVAELKGRHDELHVIGSLDLVQTLLREGLVDHLDLWVYPVLLGSGKKVFDGGVVPTALRLIRTEVFDGGSVHLEYETAGAPTFGNMATGE